jgi:hypothetical protein
MSILNEDKAPPEDRQPLPQPPAPYTAEELERDNPHNAWMYEK